MLSYLLLLLSLTAVITLLFFLRRELIIIRKEKKEENCLVATMPSGQIIVGFSIIGLGCFYGFAINYLGFIKLQPITINIICLISLALGLLHILYIKSQRVFHYKDRIIIIQLFKKAANIKLEEIQKMNFIKESKTYLIITNEGEYRIESFLLGNQDLYSIAKKNKIYVPSEATLKKREDKMLKATKNLKINAKIWGVIATIAGIVFYQLGNYEGNKNQEIITITGEFNEIKTFRGIRGTDKDDIYLYLKEDPKVPYPISSNIQKKILKEIEFTENPIIIKILTQGKLYNSIWVNNKEIASEDYFEKSYKENSKGWHRTGVITSFIGVLLLFFGFGMHKKFIKTAK